MLAGLQFSVVTSKNQVLIVTFHVFFILFFLEKDNPDSPVQICAFFLRIFVFTRQYFTIFSATHQV